MKLLLCFTILILNCGNNFHKVTESYLGLTQDKVLIDYKITLVVSDRMDSTSKAMMFEMYNIAMKKALYKITCDEIKINKDYFDTMIVTDKDIKAGWIELDYPCRLIKI